MLLLDWYTTPGSGPASVFNEHAYAARKELETVTASACVVE